MTTPEPRLDKIHLLMEETGCDQGQAELAMTSVGYDLEKAIRTIDQLLRHIVVVKCKFFMEKQNLYGRLIWVGDTRRGAALRARAVVSYNPSLYETALDEDWYDYEKNVYACRLWEGALQQITQEFERVLSERVGRESHDPLYGILREGDWARLQSLFRDVAAGFFANDALTLVARHEVLNLDQFRRIRSKDEPSYGNAAAATPAHAGGDNLALDVELVEDPNGLSADRLRPGDHVYVQVVDARDLAQYLAKLLGGREDQGIRSLAVPVEDVRREGSRLHFQMRLSAGILGVANAPIDRRVAVHRRSAAKGWRRWFPLHG